MPAIISITLIVSFRDDIQKTVTVKPSLSTRLGNKLNNTTSLLNLALSFLADVAGLDDERDVGETALSENLGVAQSEEVKGDGLVGGGFVAQVFRTSLLWDKSPKLFRDVLAAVQPCFIFSLHDDPGRKGEEAIYLVEVDGWLPEVVALKVEVSHTNLTEVTRVVLVNVGTVVVLCSY